MKIWKEKVKIKGKIYTVIEHTDEECSKKRNDNKTLAPSSHGFVCLYDSNGVYHSWCGICYAERFKISEKKS